MKLPDSIPRRGGNLKYDSRRFSEELNAYEGRKRTGQLLNVFPVSVAIEGRDLEDDVETADALLTTR
jgi:hypothetical protein